MKAVGVFKDLMEFSSTSSNYKVYRAYLETAKPPMIPQLGTILKDLTFAEDGNSNFFSEGQEPVINFGKMRMLGEIMGDVHRRQQAGYLYQEDPVIQTYIKQATVYSTDKELRELSLSREPSYRHSFAGPLDAKTITNYLATNSK